MGPDSRSLGLNSWSLELDHQSLGSDGLWGAENMVSEIK